MGHTGSQESNVGNVVLEQQQIVQSDATAVADWNAQQASASSCGLGNLGSCVSDAANWVGQNKLAVITGIITVASVACVVATVGICAGVAAPVIAGEVAVGGVAVVVVDAAVPLAEDVVEGALENGARRRVASRRTPPRWTPRRTGTTATDFA
jgi:hypothetical protein